MSAAENQDRRGDQKSELLKHLHNPTELRMIVAGIVLAIGYGAVFLPLDQKIATATRNCQEAKTRLKLAEDVDHLRKQFELVEKRLPQQTDSNEWMQYMLSGIKLFPIKLDSINPSSPQALGPYQVITFSIRFSGTYADVDSFLYWLDSNTRLIRVNSINLSPKADGSVNVDLIVVGVMS